MKSIANNSQMTQIEFLKRAIELSEKHNAPIKMCVDNELASEFGWTNHKIKKVVFSYWIRIDDRIYTDEDEAKERVQDDIFDCHVLDEAEFEKKVDDFLNEHETDVICVYTEAA